MKEIIRSIDAGSPAHKRRIHPGDRLVSVNGNPIHDGDVEKAGDPAYAGMWYVNITSREKPQIVGPDRRPVTDPSEIYSGIWGRFTMNAYPYNRSGSGISFGLLNFQKLEDDEPLGGFRSFAAADFGDPDDDDWL